MTNEPLIEPAVEKILEARRGVGDGRGVLVALTGIDGSGKGHVAKKLATALEAAGLRVAGIGVDGWLNLPHVRFAASNPAEHFYQHAIRFGPMFDQLVLPLRKKRSLRLEADLVEETSTEYCRHTYAFEDVDVVLLEGIYLLKPAYRRHYDLSLWIDCSFDTALRRALARAQEGLPPAETLRLYRTIYFPAQKLHSARDRPRAAASAIIRNDPAFSYFS